MSFVLTDQYPIHFVLKKGMNQSQFGPHRLLLCQQCFETVASVFTNAEIQKYKNCHISIIHDCYLLFFIICFQIYC